MAGVALGRRRWTPGPNVSVDSAHPLGVRLGFGWVAAAGHKNIVTGATAAVTLSSSTPFTESPYGRAFNYGATGIAQHKCDPWDDPVAAAIGFKAPSAASTVAFMALMGTGAAGTRIRFGMNSSFKPLATSGNVADYTFSSMPTLTSGEHYVLIYQLTSSTVECYMPGASQSLSGVGMTANDGNVFIGCWGNPLPVFEPCNTPISFAFVWRRTLSAAERSMVFSDPFCMLRGA